MTTLIRTIIDHTTPKDLAIDFLAAEDDDQLLFSAEMIQHLDYYAFSDDFTLNATNYFVNAALDTGFDDHSMDLETEVEFYQKGIEFGKKCQEQLDNLLKPNLDTGAKWVPNTIHKISYRYAGSE